MPASDQSVRGATGRRQTLALGGGIPVPILHGGTCWLHDNDRLVLRGGPYEHAVRVGDADHQPTQLVARFPTPPDLSASFDLVVEPAEGESYTLLHQLPLVVPAGLNDAP